MSHTIYSTIHYESNYVITRVDRKKKHILRCCFELSNVIDRSVNVVWHRISLAKEFSNFSWEKKHTDIILEKSILILVSLGD